MKGNIFLATKKLDDAIKIFENLVNEYPEQARKDNVSLHLAACYEEKKDFSRAIEVLDEMKSEAGAPGFLDERIEKLKKRESYLPGAKGHLHR